MWENSGTIPEIFTASTWDKETAGAICVLCFPASSKLKIWIPAANLKLRLGTLNFSLHGIHHPGIHILCILSSFNQRSIDFNTVNMHRDVQGVFDTGPPPKSHINWSKIKTHCVCTGPCMLILLSTKVLIF